MKNEIDILNEEGKKTGKTANIIEIHDKDFWHAVAHIWIYNKEGQVLLQLRAKNKKSYPGLWDISAAGHVDAGETVIEAATRETKEEIGLDIDRKKLEGIFIKKNSCLNSVGNRQNNEFQYVYLYNWNGEINNLIMQKEELDELAFMNIDDFAKEVEDDNKKKKYVEHNKEYYEKVISEIKKRIS